MITAHDLWRWLRELHSVPEPSVDRIIVGDPAIPVRGLAVVWMPTWQALRQAASAGANVVIAHEPTFFTHHDLEGFDAAFAEAPDRARRLLQQTRDEKRRWIQENGLVIIRCHDVVDTMPGGVVDSLLEGLGFADSDVVQRWNRYRVVRLPAPAPAFAVARRLADSFSRMSVSGIGFYGDPDRVVRTLGLGTGYGCEPVRFVELGAEMGLTIHDRIKTWTEGEWSGDSGYPLAVIDHGTSEEWGIRRLSEKVQRQFPEVPVRLIKQGCSHRWITPPRGGETP